MRFWRLIPFLLILSLLVFAVGWHIALVATTPYSIFKMHRTLMTSLYCYGVLSYFLSLLYLLSRYWASGKSIDLFVKIGWLVLLLLSLLMRIIDWNVFYYYGSHVDKLFWQFSNQGRQGNAMAFTAVALGSMGIGLSILLLFVFFQQRLKKYFLKIKSFSWRRRTWFIAGLPLLQLAVSLALFDGGSRLFFSGTKKSNPYDRIYLMKIPEEQFINSWIGYKFDKEKVDESALPDPRFTKKLSARGLKLYSQGHQFPLRKKSIYFDSANRSPDLPRVEPRTNIILVIAESYSSFFIDEKKHGFPGLTKNINLFQKSAVSFNILNTITPTYHGTIGILASQLHMYRTTIDKRRQDHKDISELFDAGQSFGGARYEFLSDILKDYGYESYYYHGSDGKFANLKKTLLEQSFESVVADDTPGLQKFAKRKKASWGYSDDDLFQYTIEFLKKRSQEKPLFLVIDTADIHHPYDYFDQLEGVSSGVLNCAYSTDLAFGKLWDYFQDSSYYDNTILIFTADHAIFPTIPYMSLRKDFISSYYDYIPFIVYIPGAGTSFRNVKKSIPGSSLDIAPTLLDLMNIDLANSFLGLSLFSERQKFPMIWARKNLNGRYNPNGLSWSDKDQERYIGFLKYLSYTNRIVPMR